MTTWQRSGAPTPTGVPATATQTKRPAACPASATAGGAVSFPETSHPATGSPTAIAEPTVGFPPSGARMNDSPAVTQGERLALEPR